MGSIIFLLFCAGSIVLLFILRPQIEKALRGKEKWNSSTIVGRRKLTVKYRNGRKAEIDSLITKEESSFGNTRYIAHFENGGYDYQKEINKEIFEKENKVEFVV